MSKAILISGSIIFGLIIAVYFFLPAILEKIGLHPHMEKQSFRVSGKKALIVTTSQATLGDGGKATGVFASELTVPYYEFLDSGMDVDVASMRGGSIPVEKMSIRWPIASWADKRFLKDDALQQKVDQSLAVEDLDFSRYDVVFFAGGWGAAYDLGYSDVLGKLVSRAYKEGVIFGSVCHGALGFIKAVDDEGAPLVQGWKLTAVTDKQIEELGITMTPLHPETELRKLGVLFESQSASKDMFATHVVVDGQFVTGQNQNSGQEAAYEIMKILERR